MPVTPQERTEELSKAYKQVISLGFAALETGWEQTTAAAKLFATASQTESDEAGKNWKAAVNQAQSRNEKLADILKDTATFPAPDAAGFKPETKELVDQLIEGGKSLSHSWTEYLTGLEKRQAALLKGLSESNSKIIESSQDLAKSAAAYSEAFLEWSREAAQGVSPNVED